MHACRSTLEDPTGRAESLARITGPFRLDFAIRVGNRELPILGPMRGVEIGAATEYTIEVDLELQRAVDRAIEGARK